METVIIRQILTYKDCPRAEMVDVCKTYFQNEIKKAVLNINIIHAM